MDTIKDKMNAELKDTETRSKTFEVRGSTDIDMDDNFQDKFIEKITYEPTP